MFRDKFIIPLHFKMLDSVMSYYQSGLANRISYEIMFNNYNRVIISPGSPAKPDAKYEITDVIVTRPDLTSLITMEYQSMALPYQRILRNRQISVNKSDATWSWSFNTTCKSLKGILVLFEDEEPYKQDTSRFYHSKIESLSS